MEELKTTAANRLDSLAVSRYILRIQLNLLSAPTTLNPSSGVRLNDALRFSVVSVRISSSAKLPRCPRLSSCREMLEMPSANTYLSLSISISLSRRVIMMDVIRACGWARRPITIFRPFFEPPRDVGRMKMLIPKRVNDENRLVAI